MIKFKSLFKVIAAVVGFSTTIYKLVSSANNLTDARSSLTMSLI